MELKCIKMRSTFVNSWANIEVPNWPLKKAEHTSGHKLEHTNTKRNMDVPPFDI
jgi:hypothetical protein